MPPTSNRGGNNIEQTYTLTDDNAGFWEIPWSDRLSDGNYNY